MLTYPTFALFKCDDVGKVVVADKVAIHLAVKLRATKNVVYIAYLIALGIDNLLNPTA
jgi:hypothetical protein